MQIGRDFSRGRATSARDSRPRRSSRADDGISAAVWAPGAWLYRTDSAAILEPLRKPPIAPSDVTGSYPVNELQGGTQLIGGFEVRASPQPRHWASSAGPRVADHVALITDTPYEASSAQVAEGVTHLLHEVWSSSGDPIYPDRDAPAADAARVAREAGATDLTLIHLNPNLGDLSFLLDDASPTFERVALGEDGPTESGARDPAGNQTPDGAGGT